MKHLCRWIAPSLLGIALLPAWSAARADTTYVYQGNTFAQADPPYTTSDRITGNFSLPVPLAPSLPLTPITDVLTAFAFNDGVQTRTQADSTVCRFSVATDAEGNIIDWQVAVREAPPSAPGDPQRVLDSEPAGDQVGTGPAAGTPCDTINLTASASNTGGGSWTVSIPGVPTAYDYMGTPFTTADPPWSVGDRVAGSVVFSDRLPPLVVDRDLSFAVQDFSFNDGVQTRTRADSTVCSFRVTTDTTGAIVAWSIALREAPTPMVGDPQRALATTSTVGISDQAGELPANPTACGDGVLNPFAFSAAPGTWSGPMLPPVPTVYTYEAQPFTVATPPFAVGQRILGSIELPAPLPRNLPLTEIGFALSSMTFEDGVQVRSLGNSTLCRFQVATNSVGEIVTWEVSLRESGVSPGDPLEVLDSFGPSGPFDQSGIGPAPLAPCDQITLDVAGTSTVAGSWRGSAGGLPIPTLGGGAMIALATLLGLGGLVAMRRMRRRHVV